MVDVFLDLPQMSSVFIKLIISTSQDLQKKYSILRIIGAPNYKVHRQLVV